MSILGALKKGLEVAAKSLLLCLVVMIILFIGYLIIGYLLGATMLVTKFPPITPDMTQAQISALNWGQVNWALFIPVAIVLLAMFFLLYSVIQSGIIGVLKDCVTEGKEKISAFFGYVAKYCSKLFLQILLIFIVMVICMIIALLLMIAVMGLTKSQALVQAMAYIVVMPVIIYIGLVLLYSQISLIFNSSKAIAALGAGFKFLNKNILKAILLFIITIAIYLVFYVARWQLTLVTFNWPIVSRVIWILLTSYIELIVMIFMMGSFVSFYSAKAGNKI